MKKYLITSRLYYTDTPAVFRSILHERIAEHMPDFVLYRDKTDPKYALQAEHLVEVCRQFSGVKSFIHQDPKLANGLRADGVHLNAKQFEKIDEAKSLGLEVCVSTHSIDELLEAERLGADYAAFSPIFATPQKGAAKGVDMLAEAVNTVKNLKIFALGGIITDAHIKQIEYAKPYGFASIRYFYEDN